jgi:O-glycosyl hydrolase
VTLKERSPKYVAAKHFFRFIRPGSRRIGVRLMPDTSVQASAYVHPQHGHRVAVLLNLESDPRDIDLTVFLDGAELTEAYVSSESSLFLNVTKAAQQSKKLALPARSIATLVAVPPS